MSLSELNRAWLSASITLEARVAAEKNYFVVPESLVQEPREERTTRPMFPSIEYEQEIFILSSTGTVSRGEFENATITFQRDGDMQVKVKYCHRNRFFTTTGMGREMCFHSESEVYRYLMGEDITPSSLKEYRYISEIVDLLNRKFYMFYSEESKMYIPRQVDMILSVTLDPINTDLDYKASVLARKDGIIEVTESLLFSTVEEAVEKALELNRK